MSPENNDVSQLPFSRLSAVRHCSHGRRPIRNRHFHLAHSRSAITNIHRQCVGHLDLSSLCRKSANEQIIRTLDPLTSTQQICSNETHPACSTIECLCGAEFRGSAAAYEKLTCSQADIDSASANFRALSVLAPRLASTLLPAKY